VSYCLIYVAHVEIYYYVFQFKNVFIMYYVASLSFSFNIQDKDVQVWYHEKS